MTWSATGLPIGETLATSTGTACTISGTIALGDGNVGSFDPVITATEGADSTNEVFNWNITSPIDIHSIDTQNSTESANVTVSLSATDANGFTPTFTAIGLPAGLSINTGGTITGTIAIGDGNTPTYDPVVTVIDGSDSSSETLTWNVANPLSLGGLFTEQGTEDVPATVSLNGSSVSVTYTEQGLPFGLGINPTSGLITGTIARGAGNEGALTPTITVTDGSHELSGSFQWNVASAISLSIVPAQATSEGSPVTLSLSATDSGETVTYTASNLPAGLSLVSTTTGTVTYTMIEGTIATGAANAGLVESEITATDGTAVTSENVVWDVQSAISIGSIATQSTVEGSSPGTLTLSASDADTSVYTWSALDLPAGLTLTTSGTLASITGTVASDAGQNGAVVAEVMVSDGTDFATESFTWNLSSPISIGSISLNSVSLQINQGGDSVSISLSATDSVSGHGSFTWSATGLPEGLSITATSGLITGTVLAGATDDFTLTPVITCSDGMYSGSTELTWNIGPVVVDQSYSTTEGVSLSVPASLGALTGATAPSTLTLTATILTEPSHGTLSTTLAPDGSFGYTPNSGWVGTDSFTYEVSDGTAEAVATASIQTYESLSSNTDFDAVASGDFTNNGNADIVAINNNGTVSSAWIFMGNGQGGFGSPTTYPLGNNPVAVAVGDILGNSEQDIVVANQGNASVTILTNTGAGTFTTASVTVGSDPSSVAIGDFTGIGEPEIAVANKGSDTISILVYNSGTMTWSVGYTISLTSGAAPVSVVAADLSNNDLDDLVIADSGEISGTYDVTVALSNGSGGFTTTNYALPGATSPSAVVAADFTGSGIIDVAVANSGSSNVTVLMGNGDGTLNTATATNYAVAANPVALVAAQIEGTGYMDLLVANNNSTSSGYDTILANNADGSGTFTALPQTIATEAGVTGVAVFNVESAVYEVVSNHAIVLPLTHVNLAAKPTVTVQLVAPSTAKEGEGLGFDPLKNLGPVSTGNPKAASTVKYGFKVIIKGTGALNDVGITQRIFRIGTLISNEGKTTTVYIKSNEFPDAPDAITDADDIAKAQESFKQLNASLTAKAWDNVLTVDKDVQDQLKAKDNAVKKIANGTEIMWVDAPALNNITAGVTSVSLDFAIEVYTVSANTIEARFTVVEKATRPKAGEDWTITVTLNPKMEGNPPGKTWK